MAFLKFSEKTAVLVMRGFCLTAKTCQMFSYYREVITLKLTSVWLVLVLFSHHEEPPWRKLPIEGVWDHFHVPSFVCRKVGVHLCKWSKKQLRIWPALAGRMFRCPGLVVNGPGQSLQEKQTKDLSAEEGCELTHCFTAAELAKVVARCR